ncbi:hypothetical protein [Pectobacterium colocasium]|nr:hypothetical protein [Pectobacterium colocasium]
MPSLCITRYSEGKREMIEIRMACCITVVQVKRATVHFWFIRRQATVRQ